MYGASMLFFFAALEHLDVTVASVSLYLVPIFGVLMAAVLLGERLERAGHGGLRNCPGRDRPHHEIRHQLLTL